MSEHVITRWDKVEVLRLARRRRALAELDYRRAVIDVVESGLEVAEVAQRLRVPEATLEGVWNLCEGITEAADGFSGSSPSEIVQRHEVGMLSAEQVVEELTDWDYDGMREAQRYPPPSSDGSGYGGDDRADADADADARAEGGRGGGSDDEAGVPMRATASTSADGAGSARLDDPGWAMWLSEGALQQLYPEPDHTVQDAQDERGGAEARWVPDPDGMSVNPDGEWAQVEDAFQAGLLPAELYGQVLAAVNPGMYAGLVEGARGGAHLHDGSSEDAGK